MSLIEDSKACYDRLIKGNNNKKFLRAIATIKEACDKIEAVNGEMTYKSVATMANIGPSTIPNAKDTHYAYVTLRIQEYETKNKSKAPVPSKIDDGRQSESPRPKYPISDIDDKTRLFIDGLWTENNWLTTRNKLLEKLQGELEKNILNATRANPLSAGQMVRAGVDDEGSMRLISSGDSSVSLIPLTPELKSALDKILEIHNQVGKPLSLNEQGALIIDTKSKTEVVLLPKERRAIEEALKGPEAHKEVPDGE